MNEDPLIISAQLTIPAGEISYRASRSGGPGGQHVNTSATQVELLWDVQNSPSLTEAQRERVLAALAGRIDAAGVLHLTASETRSQLRNRQVVTERFVRLLQRALRPRRPRRATAVPAGERARRLQAKRRRAEIKRGRGGGGGEGDREGR